MVNVRLNFDHPFQGKVLLRKTNCTQPWCQVIQFDSEGETDFEIPLNVTEDGNYKVIIDWEYEGLAFFRESTIVVKNGKTVSELV